MPSEWAREIIADTGYGETAGHLRGGLTIVGQAVWFQTGARLMLLPALSIPQKKTMRMDLQKTVWKYGAFRSGYY